MQGLQGVCTALDVIMRCAGEVYALNGPRYYYNLECRAVAGTKESNWDLGPKLVHGDAFLRTSWKELRLPSVVARRVLDASWHFGYLMTLDEMRTKLCLNSDVAVRRACASASILNRLAVAAATCANPFGREDVPLAMYPFLYEELPAHATYLPNRERFLRPGEPAGPAGRPVPDVESMPHLGLPRNGPSNLPTMHTSAVILHTGGDMYKQLAVLTKRERDAQRGAFAWFVAVAFAVLLCHFITRGRCLQNARQLVAGYSELGLRLAGIGSFA